MTCSLQSRKLIAGMPTQPQTPRITISQPQPASEPVLVDDIIRLMHHAQSTQATQYTLHTGQTAPHSQLVPQSPVTPAPTGPPPTHTTPAPQPPQPTTTVPPPTDMAPPQTPQKPPHQQKTSIPTGQTPQPQPIDQLIQRTARPAPQTISTMAESDSHPHHHAATTTNTIPQQLYYTRRSQHQVRHAANQATMQGKTPAQERESKRNS